MHAGCRVRSPHGRRRAADAGPCAASYPFSKWPSRLPPLRPPAHALQLDEAVRELQAARERQVVSEAQIKQLITELEEERGRRDAQQRTLREARQGEEDARAEAERLEKR